MRYVAALLVALVVVAAVPVAAERVTTIDVMPLRENILSLDHEWIGSNLTSTGIKLALGRQVLDADEMTLLGGAIGRRWYIAAQDNPARKVYTGGHLFGQQIKTENQGGTETHSAVGIISELGFKVRTRLGATIDVGPTVTVPVYTRAAYPDGEVDESFLAPIATNWKIGVGFSW